MDLAIPDLRILSCHLHQPRPPNPSPTSACPPRSSTLLGRDGITDPFPIQAATLPDSLAGRDVLGRGRTGSRQDPRLRAAAASPASPPAPRRAEPRPPARARSSRRPASSPPRSHAALDAARPAPPACARTRSSAASARTRRSQALRRGVDIVVACPGRLEDLMQPGPLSTSTTSRSPCSTRPTTWPTSASSPACAACSTRTPTGGQRLLFSATLDSGVDVLVKRYLHEPGHPPGRLGAVAGRRRWSHHVLHVTADDQPAVAASTSPSAPGRTIVFTRTKHRRQEARPPAQRARACPPVDLHGNLTPERPRPATSPRSHDGDAPRAGRHRHRRPRHPRRRRRPRRPRRPAGRAQGLPAPLGPHRPRRRRRAPSSR